MNVQRFGFDRVFRVPASAASAAAEEKPHDDGLLQQRIAALEAELDRTKAANLIELAHARRDGFSAGLVQARTEREAAILAATDALQAALEDIEHRLIAAEASMMSDMAALALTAADVIAGHAVDRAPVRAVDEALGRVLGEVARGTAIGIRVHPSIAAEMEAMVRARQSQDRRRLDLTVIADAGLAPGDGSIFWEEGGAIVDADARRLAVMAEVGPLFAPSSEGLSGDERI